MKKFLPFILIGIAIALWVATKGKKAPLTGVAVSAAGAQAIIDNPTKAIESHQAYVEKYPSSVDIMDQIDSHLVRGTAHVEDIIRAETELSVYAQYVADGGTKTFEQFMITDYSSMPTVYKQQIDAAKAASASYAADELISGYQTTDAYGNVTGIRLDALKEYVEGHSKTSPIMQDIRARFPEVFMVAIPEEPAPTVAQEVTSPAPISEPEPPAPEPEPFTATAKQLDEIAAEVGRASTEYQESIDRAFEAAVAASRNGDGGNGGGSVVSWSAEGGYESISSEEAYAAYW